MALLLVLALPFGAVSQKKAKSGISGKVVDQAGKPVPFTTISVEKSGLGTMANENGEYVLGLEKGDWPVIFHCLGYTPERRTVSIPEGGGLQGINVSLNEQVIQTGDVMVASRVEDPAYAIMRKAIARARINKLRIDAFEADVYIKGSGRITELPFLIRGLAKKEGFDEKTVFFKETFETLTFKQPNQYKEKVTAARSTFGNVDIQQNYLKADLYNPQYGGTVSPLAPNAFRYYRFEYLGSFQDRGHEVFKIKLSPRFDDDNYWKGEIFILDKLWCLHSAHMTQEENDNRATLTQTYAPVDGVWMLIQNKQEMKGKALGIGVEAVYFSQIRKYKITKNARLEAEFQALEQQLDDKAVEVKKKPDLAEKDLKKLDKLDKKAVRKMARAYLKEKYLKRKKEPETARVAASVVSDVEYSVDSAAYKKDTLFWQENRPVPLTEMEVISFRKLDSLRVADEREDSIKKAKGKSGGGGNPLGVLMGTQKAFGKRDSLGRRAFYLKQFSPLKSLIYNAVEGYALEETIWMQWFMAPSRSRVFDDRPYLQFGPALRYSTAREKFLGNGVVQLAIPNWEFQASGGSDIRQINNNDPIASSLNSTMALLFRENYSKLYESEFLRLDILRKLTGRLEAQVSLDWENRIPLSNANLKTWRGKPLNFEPNRIELPFAATALQGRHVISRIQVQVDWYPFLTSVRYNGEQRFSAGSSPRIRLEAMQAIPGIGGSTAEFSKVSASVRHSWSITPNTTLETFARSAFFISRTTFGQMDALHVWGNETPFLASQHVEQFRTLPYYRMSATRPLFEGHAQLYRKSLVLGWFFPKKRNWEEVLIANGLVNTGQPAFYEVGYGVHKFLRFLHAEVLYSGFDNRPGYWSVRVGLSTSLRIKPRTFNRSIETSLEI